MDVIESEGQEDDTYWIYLRPGFIVAEAGAHQIAEDTKRQARAKLAGIERCSCAECVSQADVAEISTAVEPDRTPL